MHGTTSLFSEANLAETVPRSQLDSRESGRRKSAAPDRYTVR